MLCCSGKNSGKNRRSLWVAVLAIGALIAVGYYFRWPIVTNYWWILVFLLCPILHLSMMGGGEHGEHGSGHPHDHSAKAKGKGGGCCH